MTYCVLLAGGVGQRVGAKVPKQFVEVLGRPVIAYTLDKLEGHFEVDKILIVCHVQWQDRLREIISGNRYKKVFKIVDGGKDFQHSMMNGIYALNGVAADDDIVLTHWAASPFVTDDVISDNIRVCRERGNAMSACPFFLIVGTNDGDRSSRWIDRDSIIQLNAPQSFKFKFAYEFYQKAEREGLIDQVEPHTTTLMYKMGLPIFYSKGSQLNFKITTPEDIDLFQGYLMAKGLAEVAKPPVVNREVVGN